MNQFLKRGLAAMLPALLSAVLLLAGCGNERAPDEASRSPEESLGDGAIKGAHGGRLLEGAAFSVELAIFEAGVPPEYRAWITADGAAVDPAQVELAVELGRLGGRVDRIGFAPQGDFLRGDRTVEEPHSFDVTVTATYAGQTQTWTYASYEGRTTIDPAMAKQAGITTATAGPGVITESIRVHGVIAPDANRIRAVKARFPGVVRSLSRQVGDTVRAGEVLATVESNDSLQTYTVTAPIGGVVTQRHFGAGEQTNGEALFEIADFSRVWAEFSVFPRDRQRLREGQPVTVMSEGGATAQGTISYFSPLANRAAQSVTARVVLNNGDGMWTPGQYVEGRVTVAETPVALAVPQSALQQFRDFTVVFAQVGDTYEVRMLELGRRDAEQVEVLAGLAPGTRYVIHNSYLIKADIEKSGASHDH
ncbi:MAG TPA: efflux RND transporter periplasmic adaptor subunit [Candidatus Macondimonas sp.]|nr:efflux RND transporter periplasmic adaptor subunit [Candidatus Macondimonas sp.]